MRPDLTNWQEQSAYDYLDRLDVEDLAWEGLRRNRDFQRACPGLLIQMGDAADLAVRRWGLRFRGAA